MTVTHCFQYAKRTKDGEKLAVTACLEHIQGNARPHFSVTAELADKRGRCIAAGCLHDEIRRYFPSLEPIIELHLSDDLGVPMHAEANGWYWLAGALGGMGEKYHGGNSPHAMKSKEECLEIFAKHVRIPLDYARGVALAVKEDTNPRQIFAEWIRAQAGRWKQEAEQGIALLERLRNPEAFSIGKEGA